MQSVYVQYEDAPPGTTRKFTSTEALDSALIAYPVGGEWLQRSEELTFNGRSCWGVRNQRSVLQLM